VDIRGSDEAVRLAGPVEATDLIGWLTLDKLVQCAGISPSHSTPEFL
jgi:hypothetical protein